MLSRNKIPRQIQRTPRPDGFSLSFMAMASPCEVLIDTTDKQHAIDIGHIVANEAWRIEDKYSRYQPQSLLSQLNANAGKTCAIDEETFLLLQFADQCFSLSDGLFDITSGILRKAWHFDGSNNVPSTQQVERLMPFVGWKNVHFNETSLTMKENMELDLGGIGKEYAVDKALLLAQSSTQAPLLINFGGDIAVNGVRGNNQPWIVGVEHPSLDDSREMLVQISQGAIATSGDAKRFLLKHNKRYGHVLNVKTGWPVPNAPRSVTVAAPKCIQAGLLATLALLQGEHAEHFLTQADITHWLIK